MKFITNWFGRKKKTQTQIPSISSESGQNKASDLDPDTFDGPYAEVLQKLARLKEKDPNFLVFGSERWAYEMKKITPADLEYLEKRYTVSLPEDFKTFVLAVGMGAAPSYGPSPNHLLEIQQYDEDPEDDFYAPLTNKYLIVSEHGHGIETVLIVEGKHKGEIWLNNDFGIHKYAENYVQWYIKWLNAVTAVLENETGRDITFITGQF